MNVVKVMGGLGNQMFQYAFAKRVRAKLDLSFYESKDNHTALIPTREFLLDKFNCHYDISYNDPFTFYVDEKVYDETWYYSDTYFDGYWQRPSLYAYFYHELLKDFTLKDEYINSDMKDIRDAMLLFNSCAVHVRRTDYVKLGHELDLSYYESAIEGIKERNKDIEWFIFSDDIEWCEKYLPIKNRTFCHFHDYQDLWLMTHAKHIIMANSTFSFWGQYLNRNLKSVVMPKDWKGVPSIINDNGEYK